MEEEGEEEGEKLEECGRRSCLSIIEAGRTKDESGGRSRGGPRGKVTCNLQVVGISERKVKGREFRGGGGRSKVRKVTGKKLKQKVILAGK